MFGVTANETGLESAALYEELVAIQQRLLCNLGLHGQVCMKHCSKCFKVAFTVDGNVYRRL